MLAEGDDDEFYVQLSFRLTHLLAIVPFFPGFISFSFVFTHSLPLWLEYKLVDEQSKEKNGKKLKFMKRKQNN